MGRAIKMVIPHGKGYITDLEKRVTDSGYRFFHVACNMMDHMEVSAIGKRSNLDDFLESGGKPRYIVLVDVDKSESFVKHLFKMFMETGKIGETVLTDDDVLISVRYK